MLLHHLFLQDSRFHRISVSDCLIVLCLERHAGIIVRFRRIVDGRHPLKLGFAFLVGLPVRFKLGFAFFQLGLALLQLGFALGKLGFALFQLALPLLILLVRFGQLCRIGVVCRLA